MKKFLFVLIMASGITAAPMAYAASLPECGNSYAFQFHGTEPAPSGASPLAYIGGVGQITFGPASTLSRRGVVNGCTVTHLEMIYNDNDVLGFSAGPKDCRAGISPVGLPCFDGSDHEAAPGTLTAYTTSQGGATLSITPSFNWVNGVDTTASLALSFNLYAGAGASTVLGTSVAPAGSSLPAGSPPANPVLTITMQKQSSTVTPDSFGVAPYLGRFVVSLEGYTAPAADTYAQTYLAGTYGSAVGEFQISSGALSGGGNLSFNNNDNINLTIATGPVVNCYNTPFPSGALNLDGTNNMFTSIYGSATCSAGDLNFPYTTSGVQWGPTDTSSYFIVTSSTPDGGIDSDVFPAGEIVLGTSYPSGPAGTLTDAVAPVTLTASNNGYVDFANSGAGECFVLLNMPAVSDGICSLSLAAAPGNPVGPSFAYVPPDTALTQYDTTVCTCIKFSPAASVSSTLTINGNNCPISGTTSYSITCKKGVTRVLPP